MTILSPLDDLNRRIAQEDANIVKHTADINDYHSQISQLSVKMAESMTAVEKTDISNVISVHSNLLDGSSKMLSESQERLSGFLSREKRFEGDDY